ncbi:MAG TPA: hypothetical protein VMA34_08320 [Terracidiphilus sp.]|nr:hypothetical protein [Terracidiphilus sp.]
MPSCPTKRATELVAMRELRIGQLAATIQIRIVRRSSDSALLIE